MASLRAEPSYSYSYSGAEYVDRISLSHNRTAHDCATLWPLSQASLEIHCKQAHRAKMPCQYPGTSGNTKRQQTE